MERYCIILCNFVNQIYLVEVAHDRLCRPPADVVCHGPVLRAREDGGEVLHVVEVLDDDPLAAVDVVAADDGRHEVGPRGRVALEKKSIAHKL